MMIPKSFNNVLLDRHGQYVIEYTLILGFAILVVLSFLPMLNDFNELTICMVTARCGALECAEMDSFAYYPDEKFEYYMEEHPKLESSSKVVFVGIEYSKKGYDPVYQKTKVQLQIIASAPSIKYAQDKKCAGDRINYHVRKQICEAFKTEKIANIYYNPAFSDRYYFTTCDVEWV